MRVAKGGDDRSPTGITVIHGAYDDSIAEGMIPWHRMIQRQGMVGWWLGCWGWQGSCLGMVAENNPAQR